MIDDYEVNHKMTKEERNEVIGSLVQKYQGCLKLIACLGDKIHDSRASLLNLAFGLDKPGEVKVSGAGFTVKDKDVHVNTEALRELLDRYHQALAEKTRLEGLLKDVGLDSTIRSR